MGVSPSLGVGSDDGGSLDVVVELLGWGVLPSVAVGESDLVVEGCPEKFIDGSLEGWSEGSIGTTVGLCETVVVVGAGGFVLNPSRFERFGLEPLLGTWLCFDDFVAPLPVPLLCFDVPSLDPLPILFILFMLFFNFNPPSLEEPEYMPFDESIGFFFSVPRLQRNLPLSRKPKSSRILLMALFPFLQRFVSPLDGRPSSFFGFEALALDRFFNTGCRCSSCFVRSMK